MGRGSGERVRGGGTASVVPGSCVILTLFVGNNVLQSLDDLRTLCHITCVEDVCSPWV